MFVYIKTALHVNRRAFGGICSVQSLWFKSYELLKKLGLDLAIGWSMWSIYMPSGWRRLPLLEQTGLFSLVACVFYTAGRSTQTGPRFLSGGAEGRL